MQLGFTAGKANGSGLGLYHAKVTLENWGGGLSIHSIEGKGTTVDLTIPLAQAPVWYIPEIFLTNMQEICIIDDDESIHAVWKKRFNDLELETEQSIKLQHFYSPEELIQWKEKESSCASMRLYLCDYEFLGSSINGLDLINKLKINYLSILVTSQFNNDQITLNCEAMGVKMLPKDMAHLISVKLY